MYTYLNLSGSNHSFSKLELKGGRLAKSPFNCFEILEPMNKFCMYDFRCLGTTFGKTFKATDGTKTQKIL